MVATPMKHTITYTCQNCGLEACVEPKGLRGTFPLGWGYAQITWCDDQGYAASQRKRLLCTACLSAVGKAFDAALLGNRHFDLLRAGLDAQRRAS